MRWQDRAALLYLVVFGILLCVGVGYWTFWPRSYDASNPVADVYIKEGAVPPLEVFCTVVDTQGRPIPSLEINCQSYSGGHGEVTDENGYARIPIGEQELLQISVNNIVVLDWSNVYRLGFPRLSRGLRARIVIKDVERVRAATLPASQGCP